MMLPRSRLHLLPLLAMLIAGRLSMMPATCEAIEWQHSYADAVSRATEQNRLIFVKFHADSCGWCRLMDQDVFQDAEVEKLLDGMECVSVDVYEDPSTAMSFGVSSLPRIVVINADGKVVGDQLGYLPLDDFIAWFMWLDFENAESPDTPTAPGFAEEAVRREIVESLAPTGNVARFSQPVRDFLGHQDPDVRKRMAEAILGLGERARSALIDALNDPYLGVRLGAMEILKQMDGPKGPFDPWAEKTERQRLQREWLREEERHGGP